MKQIDILPDDVLIEIFDFYVNMRGYNMEMDWLSLAHVCRRWRSLVFGSPSRLKLQLCCTPETPAKDTLDIWPALPLVVTGTIYFSSSMDNVIATLGRSNRVCQVSLCCLEDRTWGEVLAAMHVPFPELTDLQLSSLAETSTAIPDSFLDGSTPRLRHLELSGISFPGLPKLLSSAIHLFDLELSSIPHSGYISPEAIVAPLSVLTSLETLEIGLRSPQSHPDSESPSLPPSKRTILPALHEFRFAGVTKYLGDLVTRIDAPQLNHMRITFFNSIDFDCPRLAKFIDRTLTLKAHDTTLVRLDDYDTKVVLLGRSLTSEIRISCVSWRQEPGWQLSSVAQVCNSLPTHSPVEDLVISHESSRLFWINDPFENTLWLQVLLPFTAVKIFYLSGEFAPGIAVALQELVGARITEVLPSLQSIFIDRLEASGPFQENIGQFITARQLSGHPVAVFVGGKPLQNEEEEKEENAL